MKKSKSVLFLMGALLATLLGSTNVALADHYVASLRGDLSINNDAQIPNKRRIYKDVDPFERSWKEAPPMMPHKDYAITIKENRCMECHSEANYKEEEATKISDSHFLFHNGRKSQKVSGLRYFCNQCHAPLHKVEPLVDNTFKTTARR